MAVTVRKGNQVYIQQANQPAQQHGVMAHQPLAGALALFPDLVVIEHDPNEVMKALQEAAHAALRFTPNIVMQRDGGLIAEVSASLRLFGGLKKLCQLLNRAVAAQGLQLCTGIAPTARGAWLLAQSAPPRTVVNGAGVRFRSLLDALPVGLLESAQPHLEVIRGIGCKTLADLRQLPRSGIARRFGPNLPAELDRAYGDSPDPQKWLEIPEYIQQTMKLMAQVESVESLLVPVQRMIEQMCGWLASRHTAVLAFSFVLHHEYSLRQPHKSTPINIRLSEQSGDPRHLMILLRERLERTKIAAPVCELELVADEITAGADANLELFPTAQSEATSLNRFIEKLTFRLGPRAISGLTVVPDHRPERSQRFEPLGMKGISSFSYRETHRETIPAELARPAWLVETPLELKLQRRQPVYGSPLKLIAGPERIEAGWWDDAPIARDYFIAENALGQLLWIYHEHNPAEKDKKGKTAKSWYLQGLFG
ncbi:MAG: DNA polymerase Y family protein [Nitrosospira sp.]|nr:DNA polymerase Y family protein [Nitrosospira sp.]